MDKTKTYLSNFLWIPKSKVSHIRLRESLILYPQLFRGSAKPLVLLREGQDHYGVPRMWGIRNVWCNPSGTFEDQSSFPLIEWPKVEFPPGMSFWSWQPLAIDNIVKIFESGSYGTLLEAPCSAGKTLMGMGIASRMGTKTLVVTHKDDLAEQWVNTVNQFFPGASIGTVKQNNWDYKDKHVVMASCKTLHTRRDVLPEGFTDNFGLVIFDEGHRYSAQTFEEVLKMFNCRHRLAVSATFRRKDNLECVWHYHIGGVGHRVNSTRLKGEYIQIDCNTSVVSSAQYRYGKLQNALLINAIADDSAYNKWLAEQVAKGAEAGRRVLLVSDRISQLQEIERLVLTSGSLYSVGLYCRTREEGGKKKTVTKADLLKAKDCNIILGTYMMISEGTDIPALDTLILATPRSDIEQVVGRIQRPKDDKKKLLVVDPVLRLDYCKKLAKKRLQVYKDLGFEGQVKK